MTPKRKKAPKMGVREKPQLRSASHMQWVRGFSCAVMDRAGHECEGRTEAHHVRGGADGGAGLKPGDDTVIPLCSLAHRMVHDLGAVTFSTRFGIDLQAIAAKFWRVSPHRKKVEADK
jgi:hypothetical protein